MTENKDYGAHSIRILRGLDAVRERPGMYIGDVGSIQGIHNMLAEAIDNAVDEGLAGHCKKIVIILQQDGSVSVSDDGRGIPIDIHEEEGISAAEVIMTQLHAGGKFDNDSYKISGGLHGVGISVVNALSSWLELHIWRDNTEYFMRFEDGVTTQSLTIIGSADGKQGTKVSFLPSAQTFDVLEYDFDMIENRIRELAFLNSGIDISVTDLRHGGRKSEFCFDGGIVAFAKHLDRSKKTLHPTIYMNGTEESVEVDLAMQWNDSYSENVQCFTNNIRQRDGGTHLAGFRSAITRSINNYAVEHFKKNKVVIQPEDIREGLTAVLSVKVPDPKFSSQGKDKLVSTEVKNIVETVVTQNFMRWLEEKPNEAKSILQRIVESSIARDAARKARDLSRKKGGLEISTLPGKLANCQEKDPSKCELILVEGESAGGSAKQGRDRRTQAILPLKGKILNVERARFDKVIGSAEVGTLISALGTGIGDSDFDLQKLKYHKVILMTDADIDGAHIRTLLMTFFYRYMPELINQGHLYIAQPPLYKVRKGQSDTYLQDEKALQDYLLNSIKYHNNLKVLNKEKEILNQIQNDLNIFDTFFLLNDFIISHQQNSRKEILEAMLLAPSFLNYKQNHDREKLAQETLIRVIEITEEECGNWNWHINPSEDTIDITQVVNGVTIVHHLNPLSLYARMSSELKTVIENHSQILSQTLTLQINNESYVCRVPSQVVTASFEHIKKGVYIQRFKGLGEMNPDQLWDTTLDPANRSLKQLSIQDGRIAEEVFSMLMGDIVEPRREFIQKNALKVDNLDA